MTSRLAFDWGEPIRARGFHAKPGVCDACGKRLPKGRRRWCSDRCLESPRLHFTPRISASTQDSGVCRICGIDAVAFRERVRVLLRHAARGQSPRWARIRDRVTGILVRNGWPTVFDRDWWDADHIIPLWEGGVHAPSNIQTLCVPCHKAKIRLEARRRASRNRRLARRSTRMEATA